VTSRVPHLRIVVAFCIAAIIGYAVFSVWAVFWSDDAAQRGDVGGTWKSFAVLAFGFWLGSSSGGKAKDDGPVPVNVTNAPSDPVPTHDSATDAVPGVYGPGQGA
jgi:hypothetical protein